MNQANPPIFVVYMVKAVVSIMLAFTVLVSQAGLPLHMHYCKGILESVTMVFKDGCDHPHEASKSDACCKGAKKDHCLITSKDCCDDQVQILMQDITSLAPHMVQWDIALATVYTIELPVLTEEIVEFVSATDLLTNDLGPPIYLLHHSLIYYG